MSAKGPLTPFNLRLLTEQVPRSVVLPLQKMKLGALTAVSILLVATYLQLRVAAWLQMPSESGVGVLQTQLGLVAEQRYCR